MSTYNSKIKIVKAVPRSKRLRDIGSTVSAATSSREVVAAPSVDMSRYMTKEVFDDLFAKVNLGTAEAPHWAIKAKYNLYSVGWLSFNGPNPGSGSDNPVIGAQNLAGLGDVALDGVLPGQVLSWNGNKWVNSTLSTGGLDELQLSQYLTSHNYVQQSDLSSYATESWVLQKLQSVGADDLFEKVNLGTAAAPVWAIKAKYNFYSVGWLSFRGPNIGDGGDAPATIASNLADLKDVNLDTLIPGQVLAWNGNKWVNSTPATSGLDESSIADYLAAHNYATHQWVNSQGFLKQHQSLAGYATEVWVNAQGFLTQHQSLAGYATETWVNSQNYATQDALGSYYNKTQVNTALGGKLDKTIFDDLFDKVNLGTTAAPVWAIKAKYSFYSIGWLSFNGANIGDGTPAALGIGSLSDVLLSTPVAGQVLAWNGTKWVNSTLATSGLDEASLANYLSSHGYATQSWANGAFVNKSGDTMTGHLTMLAKDVYLKNSTDNSQYVCYGFKNTANAIIAQIGYHNTAKRIIINPVGSSEPWVDAVGKYNLIVGNNELKYNTYTLWHSGNDGHNSGLDADLLDGVHCSDMLHFVTLYPQNLDANGIVTTGSCYVPRGDMNNSSWNGYTFTNFPTSKPQGGFMLMNLAEGNYSRQLYAAYNNPNLYVRYNYFNGTAVTWSPWRTLAFTDSTVANANSLGGKAAAQYVTTDTAQTITGVKTFTNYTKIEQALMFKDSSTTLGVYIAPDAGGNLIFNSHSNYTYKAQISRITHAGVIHAHGFVKHDGTSDQILLADGSVNAKIKAATLTTLNWSSVSVGNSSIPTMALLAYWNGRYDANSSNLTYCNQGAFGSACTYSEAQFARALTANEPPTGDINNFWSNRCVLGSTNINANAPAGNGWYNVVQIAHRNGSNDGPNYVGQIALGMTVNLDQMYYRGHRTRSWQHVLTEQNYAGYLDSHFVTLATTQTISGYKTVTAANAVGANGFNVGMRFSNSLHDSIEVAAGDCTMGLGCHSNGSWYWWYGNTAGKNYVMTYNSSIWSFRGQMLVGQMCHINQQHISFNRNNATGAIYDASKCGAQIGINNTIEGIEIATHTGTAASYAIRMLIGAHTGNVGFGTTSPQYKAHVVGDILADGGWLRTSGAKGWYNNTYGGGWWMQGNAYIENYGSKRIKISGINDYYAVWIAGGGLCCEGYGGTSWGNGHGALNVGIANNEAQTPLLLAYRIGAGIAGASRLFAMELLNNGGELRWHFANNMRFRFLSTGEFYASKGIWTDDYLSFRGQNTSSDGRFKDIQERITLPLAVIANAPSIIYRWVDNGKMDMGSIAQYWQKYLPLAVSTNPLGRLGMDYSKIALASAISIAQSLMTTQDDVKILKADVRQLKADNLRMTTENSQLKTEIQQLRTKIAV